MGKVFFIADLHLNHETILKSASRPFSSVEEMNETIIQNWNRVVKDGDKVYVLGDVGFFYPLTKENTMEIIQRLNGYKFLVMGNHDMYRKPQWWRDVGFNEVSQYPILFAKHYILSHEPIRPRPVSPYVNIHGHKHRGKMRSKQYINVSAECIDFTPISFHAIQKLKYSR